MGTSHLSITQAAKTCIENNGKILICGNGGSAAQADHFAAELIGSGLPCVALTNPAVITALANDRGYGQSLAWQVAALGHPEDVLIALTTSNLSRNILWACAAGHRMGMSVYTVTGWDAPDTMHSKFIRVESNETKRIQELTLWVLHDLWEALK